MIKRCPYILIEDIAKLILVDLILHNLYSITFVRRLLNSICNLFFFFFNINTYTISLDIEINNH